MMTPTNAPPAYVAAPQPVGQQQLVTVQPAAGVTFGTVNPQPRSGNWKGILWTGIIQVVLGSLTVILGIVTLSAFNRVNDSSDIASPLWCGIVFYGFAGICGIVSGSKKHSGWAVGYMVMSILACLATCCVIGFGAARMSFINEHCYPRLITRYLYNYYGRVVAVFVAVYDDPRSHCDLKAAINDVSATLILLAMVEFIVAIIGASMACGPLCSGGSATQTVLFAVSCHGIPLKLVDEMYKDPLPSSTTRGGYHTALGTGLLQRSRWPATNCLPSSAGAVSTGSSAPTCLPSPAGAVSAGSSAPNR
ncbi:uncharacterized protein LOC119730145 [Patiria miniata]|uniref:Uncharacterized protein n=1 Tax=Patiria miniata TaxID=46514 RepID=A0A914A615_PATMI|nr:uncharacterized protein LOC119730145 [Patiria miniata]